MEEEWLTPDKAVELLHKSTKDKLREHFLDTEVYKKFEGKIVARNKRTYIFEGSKAELEEIKKIKDVVEQEVAKTYSPYTSIDAHILLSIVEGRDAEIEMDGRNFLSTTIDFYARNTFAKRIITELTISDLKTFGKRLRKASEPIHNRLDNRL